MTKQVELNFICFGETNINWSPLNFMNQVNIYETILMLLYGFKISSMLVSYPNRRLLFHSNYEMN